jgi:hypothetical protein
MLAICTRLIANKQKLKHFRKLAKKARFCIPGARLLQRMDVSLCFCDTKCNGFGPL